MNEPTMLEHGPRRCVLLGVEPSSPPELADLGAQLGPGEPFVGVLWDAIGGSAAEERLDLGRQLLAAGCRCCRYIVFGGENCEAWHDAVDLAFVELPGPSGRRPEAEEEARPVMTTWHTGESVEEVVWFAFACTHFAELSFRRWLVVLRGGDERLRERFERAVRAEIGRGEDEIEQADDE